MAAVLFIDDMLPDHGAGDRSSRWPLIGLTATVILLSRDPLIAVLAVVVAAPLAGLVKGQSILAQLTKTTWWLVACGIGLLAFGAVANAGHAGFALGSVVLIVVYAIGEAAVLFALRLGSQRSGTSLVHRLDEMYAPLIFGGIGAIYAWSWRSSQFGSLNLDGGQLAILASVAIVVGHLVGGTVANLWRGTDRISDRIIFLPLLVCLGVVVLPRGAALAIVTFVVAIVLVVSVRTRTVGGVIACVGGLANLLVVQLNGGMPTEASAFFRLVGPAGYARYAGQTQLEDLNTKLPVLDDRILLPHPVPFAEVLSVGDLILAAGLMLLIVDRMIARPRVAGEIVSDGRLTAA